MKSIKALVLFIILYLISCGYKNEPIVDIEWKLKSIDQHSVSEFNIEKIPTIKFVSKKNRLAGFAGCNNYFGSYEITENKINFGAIGSTKMACPNLDLEDNYLKLLNTVDNYKCDGSTLKLYSGKNLIFEFIQ